MSVRLARLFGTSPEYWLNMQRNVDLWDAAEELVEEVAKIVPLQAA
jgi:plasmid maintenance system antidote protein VapI